MGWQHFDLWKSGTVHIVSHSREHNCHYEIGVITTGRQRVFHRYYFRLTLPDGAQVIGEDQHNLRSALVELHRKLVKSGFELHVAGVDPRFYETGLSHNSGLGYIDDIGRVGMMDPVMNGDARDQRVDTLVHTPSSR